MATIAASIEKHHRLIISVLALVILVMAASCIFHDVLPLCHWVFGCDHQMHVATTP
ncbi:MAG: hypothetical protein GTN93_35220 [Anaerolineae bacterium]|nr:hypothetical protein [Anaerolineae bacterium]NIQ83228.1 hypothetical protein [Anaerolineae bacterium]